MVNIMNVKIIKNENSTLLEVSGSVESSKIEELSAIIDEIIQDPTSDVEMDLDKADYIDSTGISQILKLYKSCRENGHSFSIINASERVESLLSLCSLHDCLIK